MSTQLGVNQHRDDLTGHELPPAGMARIPGGTLRMGSDVDYPEEGPAHRVTVDAFWIDRYAVTNADFSTFVSATKYITFAERPLDHGALPWCVTGITEARQRGFSYAPSPCAAPRPA